MNDPIDTLSLNPGRGGFALPAVTFALVLITVLVGARLRTSVDDRLSSRAVQHGVEAFYVAEKALGQVITDWGDTTLALDSLARDLAPGDTLAYPGSWTALAGGGSYRASIRRLDTGLQPLFLVRVEGQDASGVGGRAELIRVVTPAPTGELLGFGDCCDAAVTLRGTGRMRQGVGVDGTDTDPAGWSAQGRCTAPNADVVGLRSADMTDVSLEAPYTLTGAPASLEDTLITDSTFDSFGDLDWSQVKSLAQHAIGIPGGNQGIDAGGDPASGSTFGPRYTATGECDTSHPLNFGSDDPTSACYDYFPIILVQGDVDLQDTDMAGLEGYVQGLFILDVDIDGTGSELDIEGVRFNGLVIGKGCVEVQYGAQFMGAIFVDGDHFNTDLCQPDVAFDMNHYGTSNPPATVTYSSCVVQRVLDRSGAAYAAGEGVRGVFPIERGYYQPLR